MRCHRISYLAAVSVLAASFLFPLFFVPCGIAEFGGRPGYSGSKSCAECHEDIYLSWRITPHARMLVDAKANPTSILANKFDNIPFNKDEIVYTVGSHWVQKYLTRIDGLLYVLPKFWNVPKQDWEPYSMWNWREQPYNIYCDGCHTVGFDAETKTFFEPGVGCESCHGPGLKHIEGEGDISAIVNPGKLEWDRYLMVCMACHTDGQDKATDTHPFPVGFTPGDDLAEYYSDFFMPKPKSKAWYWGTMDLAERKRMFYFFQTKFYSTQRACDVCGVRRGGEHVERYMTRSEYCGTCHKARFENHLKHSGHEEDQAGCGDCHPPKLAANAQRYSIHDHKFDFSQPEPACTECHDAADVEGKKAPPLHDDVGGREACTECHEEDAVKAKRAPLDHTFHLKRVKFPKTMTEAEACVYCHKDKDVSWAKERIGTLVDKWMSR